MGLDVTVLTSAATSSIRLRWAGGRGRLIAFDPLIILLDALLDAPGQLMQLRNLPGFRLHR